VKFPWATLAVCGLLALIVLVGGIVQCSRDHQRAIVDCIKAGQGALECRHGLKTGATQ
jgi:N-methylhydantoinase B/oxoprolinase/acetone carboxylase alpha subunit